MADSLLRKAYVNTGSGYTQYDMYISESIAKTTINKDTTSSYLTLIKLDKSPMIAFWCGTICVDSNATSRIDWNGITPIPLDVDIVAVNSGSRTCQFKLNNAARSFQYYVLRGSGSLYGVDISGFIMYFA